MVLVTEYWKRVTLFVTLWPLLCLQLSFYILTVSHRQSLPSKYLKLWIVGVFSLENKKESGSLCSSSFTGYPLEVGLHPFLTPHRLETCRNKTQLIADGSVCTFTHWLPHNEGTTIHSLTHFFTQLKRKSLCWESIQQISLCTLEFIDVLCQMGENSRMFPGFVLTLRQCSLFISCQVQEWMFCVWVCVRVYV